MTTRRKRSVCSASKLARPSVERSGRAGSGANPLVDACQCLGHRRGDASSGAGGRAKRVIAAMSASHRKRCASIGRQNASATCCTHSAAPAAVYRICSASISGTAHASRSACSARKFVDAIAWDSLENCHPEYQLPRGGASADAAPACGFLDGLQPSRTGWIAGHGAVRGRDFHPALGVVAAGLGPRPYCRAGSVL